MQSFTLFVSCSETGSVTFMKIGDWYNRTYKVLTRVYEFRITTMCLLVLCLPMMYKGKLWKNTVSSIFLHPSPPRKYPSLVHKIWCLVLMFSYSYNRNSKSWRDSYIHHCPGHPCRQYSHSYSIIRVNSGIANLSKDGYLLWKIKTA